MVEKGLERAFGSEGTEHLNGVVLMGFRGGLVVTLD